MDGRSYYFSRNGGYMSRAINPNMSERVKTETEFLNTRLNAAEFGCAGSTASAIVRGITERYRFIRTPKMVGELTKVIENYIREDTDHSWGNRQLPASRFADVQDKFSQLFKIPMFARYVNYFKNNTHFSTHGNVFTFETELFTTIDDEQRWIAAGANGVHIEMHAYKVLPSQHVPGGYKYNPASYDWSEVSAINSDKTITGTTTHSLITPASISITPVPQNTNVNIGGMVFLLFPYKEVNNTKQIIQSQCQALWVSIPDE